MFNMIILDESSLNLVETVTALGHRPLSVVIGHRPRVFIGCTGHGPRSAPSHRPLSPIIGREQQL